MSSRLNLTFFAALAIQMLMIGATAAPLAAGLNPMGNYDKMDKSLRDFLSSSSEDEIVPVIFQLNSDVTAEDLEILESLGATILGDGSVVIILDIHSLIRAAHMQRQHRLERRAEVRALPVAEQPVELAEPVVPVTETPRETRKTPLIMVTDDSVTVRKVTTRLLERNGYEVITAKDGMDAVAKLEEHKPDLMLLDIEMPRMDGFEVATHVRHEDRLKDVPIIMITSRTGEKHRERAFDIGVNSYMGKPFQEGELLNTIQELLARAQETVGS